MEKGRIVEGAPVQFRRDGRDWCVVVVSNGGSGGERAAGAGVWNEVIGPGV